MISLLSRLFISDRQNYSDPAVRSAYGILCGAVGIFFNLLLFCAKIFAGTLSGSLSITADAFNNLSDAASSIVTLLGFKLSEKKPDSSHPFGHGRIEYIAGLVVSFLILLMGCQLAQSSFEKIRSPEPTVFSSTAVVILALSVAIKLYMALYNRSVGKKIRSAAMCAAASDSISDTVATTVVLLCMLISHFTALDIDAYCGLLVSVFILITGVRSVRETVSPLLGQPADPETVKQIHDIVYSFPEALGLHDLVIHDYGSCRRMVTLHVEVDADGDMLKLHDAIDNMERVLSKKLSCEATIHMDPVVQNNKELDDVRRYIEEYIRAEHRDLHIHDFRMVKGNTHTNVIFDIVLPYSEKHPEAVVEDLKRQINAYDSRYFAVINVDSQFVE